MRGANGRPEASLIRDGRRRTRGAIGGGEHHRSPQEFRLGGRLTDLRLPSDALELWLATPDRRRGEGRLRHPAAGQISENPPAGRGGLTFWQRNGGAEDIIGIVMPLGFGEPFGVAAIAFRHTVSIPSD